jgi:hypothetical protein
LIMRQLFFVHSFNKKVMFIFLNEMGGRLALALE